MTQVKAKAKTSSESPLVFEKVRYKYLPRSVHGIFNKNHVLFDGKLDGSIDKFPVFMGQSGKYSLDLTPKEIQWITKELGLAEGDLNPNKKPNTYLDAISIEMPKFGLNLDTENAQDYLTDRILMGYKNTIAPNLESRSHKLSYRYVRVSGDAETQLVLDKADNRKEAYKVLGQLEESRERMVMFLLNADFRIHPEIDDKTLRRQVNEVVEESYPKFLSTVNDPLFHEKGMLNMAVVTGAAQLHSGLFYYDGQALASANQVATLDNAALYLKDQKNAPIKLALSKATVEKFKLQ